jgi:RNA polymerase sigma-70 factor (ECF subfamily)
VHRDPQVAWLRGDAVVEGAIEPILSFESFFEAEQKRLLRIMWLVCGSSAEAEDIVQDAFIKVWERWPRVSMMENPTGYLHQTAMNTFRNRLRRTRLSLRKTVGTSPPNDLYGEADDRLSVSRALQSLTSKQRAALVLTDLLGYSSDEAAAMLGVRPSTVRSLAALGRKALRNTGELADG